MKKEKEKKVNLQPRSFYKNEAEFFEDAIFLKEEYSDKCEPEHLKSDVDTIRRRIKRSKPVLGLSAGVQERLSLTEAFLLCVCSAAALCGKTDDDESKKAMLLPCAMKSKLDRADKVIKIISKEESVLFKKSILLVKDNAVMLTPQISKKLSIKSADSKYPIAKGDFYESDIALLDEVMSFGHFLSGSFGRQDMREHLKELLLGIRNKIKGSLKRKIKTKFLADFPKDITLTEVYIFSKCLSKSFEKPGWWSDDFSKKEMVASAITLKFDTAQEVFNQFIEENSFLFKKNIIKAKDDNLLFSYQLLSDVISQKACKKRPENKVLSPATLCKNLDKYVVSQNEAKEKLCLGVFEHLLRCGVKKEKDVKINKNNIFMVGPTGCGKTYMCQVLGKFLNIPIFTFDATQYTKAGYVGMDIAEIIPTAYEKTKSRDAKVNPCIIFIDEIDKLAESGEASRIGHMAIQRELLKLLEADEYRTEGRWGHEACYDISNVLFIVAGAFAGLKKSGGNSSKIGFVAEGNIYPNRSFCTEDLVKYGFMQEFLGRFSHYIEFEALSRADLREILLNSKESVISGYRRLFEACGESFSLSERQINDIVENAYKNNTGARGLNNAVADIMKGRMFNMKFSPKGV